MVEVTEDVEAVEAEAVAVGEVVEKETGRVLIRGNLIIF